MVKLSRDQNTVAFDEGVEIYSGIPYFPLTESWSINIYFGKLVFKSLKNQLKKSILHYTTFGLPILSNNDDDIVTVHDLFFLEQGDEAHRKFFNVSEMILRRFLRFRNVVAPSFFIKRELEDYGFDGKIKVIYLPPQKGINFMNDKISARKILGLPMDKNLILSVSSGLRRKNLKVVAEVMGNFDDKTSLVKVGYPLDGAYNFSSLESAKLNLIYNACDAFLFPSLKEGYGRPLVEAMASGLPAVVSDIQVFREICGRSAIFVEPTKDGCLLGLKEALNNPEQIGKEGLTRSKMFSRENFINEVRQYYLSIADQRGP